MRDHRTPEKPSRNDPCTCGADRKYKKCCERVEDERRLGPKQYGHLAIKSIVLEEIRSFKEIFGVKLTDDQIEVSKNITDSDVLLFVERVQNMWGSKPDLLSEMPTKADLKFRGARNVAFSLVQRRFGIGWSAPAPPHGGGWLPRG